MSRGKSAVGHNKMLNSFHHFSTEKEMNDYIKQNNWRKYVTSHNIDETCWTVFHKER